MWCMCVSECVCVCVWVSVCVCVCGFYYYAAVLKAFCHAAWDGILITFVTRSQVRSWSEQEIDDTLLSLINQSNQTREDVCCGLIPFTVVRPWQSALHRPNVPERSCRSSHTRRETAKYMKVFFFSSSQRAPVFFFFFCVCVFFVSYHPAWNQLSYFHTENCTIIFQIRQIILLSIRLDKGDFSNYELLLCKLILRRHQGSISPAIFPLNLRGGSAGGSLTIITLIGLGSLHQNSLISLTPCHNSTEWLIEDMNWIDVSGEYEIVGIIQILKMVLPIVFFPASTLSHIMYHRILNCFALNHWWLPAVQ